MNVFVTGVSKGIGYALASQLVGDGHTVWGVSRNRDLLLKLKKEIKSNRFLFTVCDVSVEADVVRTTQLMKKHSFYPDVVVLNAAVYTKDTIPHFNNLLVSKTFMINIHGALTWVEKFLPHFNSARSGHFIALSSTSAFRPDADSISLPASKAALSMAFRSLRLRFATNNIIFSTIHFGPVATSISPRYRSRGGGPKYSFVLTAAQAAKHVQQVIAEKKSKDYFFPFFTTFVFRLTLFFPDGFFAQISKRLKN